MLDQKRLDDPRLYTSAQAWCEHAKVLSPKDPQSALWLAVCDILNHRDARELERKERAERWYREACRLKASLQNSSSRGRELRGTLKQVLGIVSDINTALDRAPFESVRTQRVRHWLRSIGGTIQLVMQTKEWTEGSEPIRAMEVQYSDDQ
jgi:hypothetical protein